MDCPNLGEPRFASSSSYTIGDDIRIPERIEIGSDPGLQFEVAGPRTKIFFEQKKTRAGIVTCGGLCPGLNNVIRSLFFELHHGYGIAEVIGFRDGYGGLDPSSGAEPAIITPQFVDSIHQKGGTILGTSRGPVGIGKAVDNLIARGVNILFTIGGDGTQRGANELYQEARRRGHALSVVGIPKTIDNDVGFVSRTFGFFTAVDESARVLDCAHTEARSVPGGIGLVKLMGRHAGFLTAGATIASQDVNFALIPEVPFSLDAFLVALKERMLAKSHAVIAVSEGAGQDLLQADPAERDASGNVKLKDIGPFLRERIEHTSRLKEFPLLCAISIRATRSVAGPQIARTTSSATSSRVMPHTPRWPARPASSSAFSTIASSMSPSSCWRDTTSALIRPAVGGARSWPPQGNRSGLHRLTVARSEHPQHPRRA
jgi:6-phosphofructokinase 1